MAKTNDPPRIQTVDRHQFRLLPTTLDELIDPHHRVRDLWKWLDSFDLEHFYSRIDARGSNPGRPAIDPKILLCLWVFATSEGIGSARQLDRLVERDLAYSWIAGGVSLNYHTLSDFRSTYEVELDALMTEILGVLLHADVLSLERVSQDGVRVRANAGAASFRREKTLKKCLKIAKEQVVEVKRQEKESEKDLSEQQKKARERGAKEKEERPQTSPAELPKGKAKGKKEIRVSTTDPEARNMKMADGGFRPAYNVQLAMDTRSGVLVGVEVLNQGNDYGEISPMREQIEHRTGKIPKEYLVDGGYSQKKDIQAAADAGSSIYAPVPKPGKKKGEADEAHQSRVDERFTPKPKDSPGVTEWKQRMNTDEAKEVYKERASTIERGNADLRAHRGLQQFPVRGKRKVRAVALLQAVTYNLLKMTKLLGAPPG
jgi:transposase